MAELGFLLRKYKNFSFSEASRGLQFVAICWGLDRGAQPIRQRGRFCPRSFPRSSIRILHAFMVWGILMDVPAGVSLWERRWAKPDGLVSPPQRIFLFASFSFARRILHDTELY